MTAVKNFFALVIADNSLAFRFYCIPISDYITVATKRENSLKTYKFINVVFRFIATEGVNK
jgi:hypothetical protein